MTERCSTRASNQSSGISLQILEFVGQFVGGASFGGASNKPLVRRT